MAGDVQEIEVGEAGFFVYISWSRLGFEAYESVVVMGGRDLVAADGEVGVGCRCCGKTWYVDVFRKWFSVGNVAAGVAGGSGKDERKDER